MRNVFIIGFLMSCLLLVSFVLVLSFFDLKFGRDIVVEDNSINEDLVKTTEKNLRNKEIKEEKKGLEIPSWLMSIIGFFAFLQICPLILAALKGSREDISSREHQVILFLCETPMYLGLLGSLVGICATQFISGTLSAPLAYVTTMTGILFYLFAKFFIWLPLPSPNDFE